MKLKNAIFEKMQSLADKSWKLIFVTRELSPEEITDLASNLGQEVDETEITLTEEDGGKSPSERLRNCLYRLWESKFKLRYPDFEVFYRAQMDKLCRKVKEKIN